MKNSKKIVCLLLALLMLASLLAGCGSEAATSPTPGQVSAPPQTQTPDGEDETAPLDDGVFKLPIVDDRIEFEVWIPVAASARIASLSDIKAYQEIDKLTNIGIKWLQPSQGEAATQFSLTIASNMYPDCFMAGPEYYIGGLDKYVDDEIILDLNDLIDDYAPNYDALRNQSDEIRKWTMTDSGAVPYFRTINYTVQPEYLGIIGRIDWLNELGLEKPRTYDEYYTVLTALKDKANIAPLSFMTNNGIDDSFSAGFGVVNRFQLDENGKVALGVTLPAFKDYLTMMNKWYAEGLIYDGFTSFVFYSDTALMTNGDLAIFPSVYVFIDMLKLMSGGTTEWGAMPLPTKNVGDKRNVAIYDIVRTLVGGAIASITTTCKDPVVMTKWLDYFYTEEGSLISNYGIEGESFEMTADGPALLPNIWANPEGLSQGDALGEFACPPNHPKLYSWEREMSPGVSEEQGGAGPLWNSNYVDTLSLPPAITPTTEESSEYSAIMTDVDTYVTEMIPRFIMGLRPIEEFDDFIAQLRAMGLDRATELRQLAYDRYLTR